ncbi:MAG: hypothetical protein ACI4Q5_02440, partial [Porcipelethomonas sp.]
MRKFLKNDILKIFPTIYEAHKSIEDFLNKKEYEAVLSLLDNCQKIILKIAAVIENSEGEGFCTISFIEDYYKTIYEVANNIDKYNASNVKQVFDEYLKK